MAAVLAGTVFGMWQQRLARPVLGGPARPGGGRSARPLTADDLGIERLGGNATLVLFSTAFCAPCRHTRVILRDVADRLPGVRFVDIDAESHLELVRALGVVKTPTVLIVDAHGRERTRAVGQPRSADVMAALAPTLG